MYTLRVCVCVRLKHESTKLALGRNLGKPGFRKPKRTVKKMRRRPACPSSCRLWPELDRCQKLFLLSVLELENLAKGQSYAWEQLRLAHQGQAASSPLEILSCHEPTDCSSGPDCLNFGPKILQSVTPTAKCFCFDTPNIPKPWFVGVCGLGSS